MADGLTRINTRSLVTAVRKLARDAGTLAARERFDAVRKDTPVSKPHAKDPSPRRGGTLRGAWKLTSSHGSTGSTFTLSNPTEYASFQESGTGPHPIRPRRPGGFLVFYWPKVGAVVFLRHVNHPGNPPLYFVKNNLNRGQWVVELKLAVRITSVRA